MINGKNAMTAIGVVNKLADKALKNRLNKINTEAEKRELVIEKKMKKDIKKIKKWNKENTENIKVLKNKKSSPSQVIKAQDGLADYFRRNGEKVVIIKDNSPENIFAIITGKKSRE